MRLLLLLPGRGAPGSDEIDARLLGRLYGVSRELPTPNESRLTPDWEASCTDDVAETCEVRFLALRSVTVFGTWCPRALPLRGLARGGVLVGAGSLDRTE